MFTSSPSLIQTIERMIDATPIVDPHTHLRCDQPGAPDLSALMSYHWLQTELIAVGMPREDLDLALPSEERVRRSIPYLRKMRNTGMAWCFYRILADLYGFSDNELTDSNYLTLCEKVAETGRDPNWAWRVLKDKCNIQTIVTSLGNRRTNPSNGQDPAGIYYMLDAHYLFCPGVATDLEPFFPGRTTKQEYFQALCNALGEKPTTLDQLRRLLFDWLDRTVTGRVRFSNTFLPIEHRPLLVDDLRVRGVFSKAVQGLPLNESQVDALAGHVGSAVLCWHHENRKAFQIAVGAEYFICEGKSIPRYQENWTSEMARVFHQYGGTKFDLMVASDLLTHETAVLARQFPNVHVSGYWWHNFFPGTIEKIVGLRMQVTPMTKFSGFLCDAYYAEWTYGKLQIVKKAIASSMAHLVEAGFYREEDLPAILQQVLHDTPRDLYDLKD